MNSSSITGALNGRHLMALMVASAILIASMALPAASATTAWKQGHHIKTRLVTGAEPYGDGLRRIVAVHMRLDPGWKTYWRHPGNSGGIPPQFDLAGSTNVAAFTVRYPAPTRYIDETGTTFGFKGDVMFPIEVVPRDPSRPVALRLNAFFGVCEEICIPVELSLTETFSPSAFRTLTPELAAAMARVPVDLDIVDAEERLRQPHAVEIIAALDGEDPHLLVHARSGAAGDVGEVLPVAHGDVFMGVPKRIGTVSRADGAAVAFKLPLMSKGDAARLKGGAVDIVVISQGGASRQTFSIPR